MVSSAQLINLGTSWKRANHLRMACQGQSLRIRFIHRELGKGKNSKAQGMYTIYCGVSSSAFVGGKATVVTLLLGLPPNMLNRRNTFSTPPSATTGVVGVPMLLVELETDVVTERAGELAESESSSVIVVVSSTTTMARWWDSRMEGMLVGGIKDLRPWVDESLPNRP